MLLNPLSHVARRAPLLSRAAAAAPLDSPWSAPAERTSAAAASAPLSSRWYSASAPRSNSQAAPAKFGSADWHSTTILCVRKDGRVCMVGDGMVSMGNVTIKPNARKVRRIATKSDRDRIGGGGDNEGGEGAAEEGGVIVGFAGATADAFTLLERLEGKIDEYPGQLTRSCVELAKGWRTDKYLRRLEASMLVADPTVSLEITGNGDVLESHDGVMGVGSGAFYAMAAARALVDIPDMSAEDVARKAMNIAAEMCVYTNKEFVVESMATVEPVPEESEDDDEE